MRRRPQQSCARIATPSGSGRRWPRSSASWLKTFPVRQAALGSLQLLVRRAFFLLDQIVLDTAAGFGGLEDAVPRRSAFAEQHRVSTSGRPVLAVEALDTARVRFDPGHRVDRKSVV